MIYRRGIKIAACVACSVCVQDHFQLSSPPSSSSSLLPLLSLIADACYYCLMLMHRGCHSAQSTHTHTILSPEPPDCAVQLLVRMYRAAQCQTLCLLLCIVLFYYYYLYSRHCTRESECTLNSIPSTIYTIQSILPKT